MTHPAWADLPRETQDALLRRWKGDPECGKDFCDACGDCLHCYPDVCYDGASQYAAHSWVIYDPTSTFGSLDQSDYYDAILAYHAERAC